MPRHDVYLAPATSNGVPLRARTFHPGLSRRLLGTLRAPAGSSLEHGRAGTVLAVPLPCGGVVRLSPADACEQAIAGAPGLAWEPAGTEPGRRMPSGPREPEEGMHAR